MIYNPIYQREKLATEKPKAKVRDRRSTQAFPGAVHWGEETANQTRPPHIKAFRLHLNVCNLPLMDADERRNPGSDHRQSAELASSLVSPVLLEPGQRTSIAEGNRTSIQRMIQKADAEVKEPPEKRVKIEVEKQGTRKEYDPTNTVTHQSTYAEATLGGEYLGKFKNDGQDHAEEKIEQKVRTKLGDPKGDSPPILLSIRMNRAPCGGSIAGHNCVQLFDTLARDYPTLKIRIKASSITAPEGLDRLAAHKQIFFRYWTAEAIAHKVFAKGRGTDEPDSKVERQRLTKEYLDKKGVQQDSIDALYQHFEDYALKRTNEKKSKVATKIVEQGGQEQGKDRLNDRTVKAHLDALYVAHHSEEGEATAKKIFGDSDEIFKGWSERGLSRAELESLQAGNPKDSD